MGDGRESAPFTLRGMRVEEGRHFKENPGVVTGMRQNDAEAGKTRVTLSLPFAPGRTGAQRRRRTPGKAFVIASKDKGVRDHMESGM